MRKTRKAQVIFDNAGGITLQLNSEYAHYYQDHEKAAEDYCLYQSGAGLEDWEGHEEELLNFMPEQESIKYGRYSVYDEKDIKDLLKKDNTCWHNETTFATVLLLNKKRFDKRENYFTKIIIGEELKDYFIGDADTTDLIESGQVKAALLEVYPGRKAINYILFETIPSEQDIANANIIYEDDFNGFMEWLQQG